MHWQPYKDFMQQSIGFQDKFDELNGAFEPLS